MNDNYNVPVKTVEQFSWKGFLSRAILVVVFVLLLTWLLPMPNVKNLENKIDNVSSQVTVITDRIFNENITNMKDAAKDYFTISRLPKNVGDKVKISLQEMIDKKLLLSVIDNKGKSCNYADSYVEITRLENEYQMKTFLSCQGASDYILSYMDLECNLSCNNECVLVEKEQPVIENKGETSSQLLYKFKKIEVVTNWTDWSAWTTEVKEADETKTKVQYKGRTWVSVPVYKYEHIREVEGEPICEEITIPGGQKCETVTVPETTVQVWVDGEERICPREEEYYEEEIKQGTRTEYYTVEECETVRYKIGSEWVKKCDTCGYELVDIYATKEVCTEVQKSRQVPYTYTELVLKYRTVYDDCSTEGYYKDEVVPAHEEEICEDLPDTKEEKCVPGEKVTETIWTNNEVEEGYTHTGNKEYVKDAGYYIYTDWVSELPAGYEQTEVRTLYSYRYQKVSTNVRYTWSKYKSLGDGWEPTGETKEINM